MRGGGAIRTVVALGLCLGTSSAAVAQPSIWDAARDPRAARDYETVVSVERLLAGDDTELFDPRRPQRIARAALTASELADHGAVSDVRLLFFLGELLSEPLVGRDREARAVLERALAREPTSPLAGRAWFNVAISSARLGEPERERAAYTHALDLVWERGFRANILTNRGESNMVVGRLEESLADYREAVRLADRPDMQALAYYGLGIALERSGDLPQALSAMRVADAIQLPGVGSALDLPSVFFVPEYDVHYYKALVAMARARDAKKAADEAESLLRAASEWQSYLEPALREKHRWVDNARRHQRWVLARLRKLSPSLRQREAAPAR